MMNLEGFGEKTAVTYLTFTIWEQRILNLPVIHGWWQDFNPRVMLLVLERCKTWPVDYAHGIIIVQHVDNKG
jgi:hypothetical protein